MKVTSLKADKDPDTGRNKISVELTEDDIVILDEIVRRTLQNEEYDKDDSKYIARLKHVEEQVHKSWTILRPS